MRHAIAALLLATLLAVSARAAESRVDAQAGGLISVTFRDAELRDALMMIAEISDLNIVIDPELKGTVTAHLRNLPPAQVVDLIVKTLGYVAVKETTMVRITRGP